MTEEDKEFQTLGEALTFLYAEGKAVEDSLKLYLHHVQEMMVQFAKALETNQNDVR